MDFAGVERRAGAKIKEDNDLVEKWRLRVKRKPGQEGAEEEFRMVLASSHTGCERYVEWVRRS